MTGLAWAICLLFADSTHASPVTNFARVTVSAGYDAAATTIILATGHGGKLPATDNGATFPLVWWNATDYPDPTDDPFAEIVNVTTRSGDTLTLTRGFDGTTATTKNTLLKTYKMMLAITRTLWEQANPADTLGIGGYPDFVTAVTKIGTAVKTLKIDRPTTITSGISTPSTLTLEFTTAGRLVCPTAGVIITINGPIIAGLQDLFDMSGGCSVSTPLASVVTPVWWDPLGDGTSSRNAAFTAAIGALHPTRGGMLFVPAAPGEYVLDLASLNPGAKPLRIQGQGWKTLVCAAFGDAQWTAANAVTGTVLKITGTQDGVIANDVTYRKLELYDIALVGPGTGTSVGINYGLGAQSNNLRVGNVLVANFKTGLRFNNSLDNVLEQFFAWGNDVGYSTISTGGGITDTRFYEPNIQCNATGISARGGNLFKHYGGLIQDNTTVGVAFNPDGSNGVENWHFDGTWFENVGPPFTFNTTTGVIQNVTFRNIRNAETATISPTIGAQPLVGLTFEDSKMNGITLDFSADGMRDIKLENLTIAAITMPNDGAEICRVNVNGITACSSLPQTITWASSVTPDCKNGVVQQLTMTGNTTINDPVNCPVGADLILILRQDATGGRTVTWGGAYHGLTWSDAGNTANKYSTVGFKMIQTNPIWVMVSAQTPYVL